MVGYHQFGSLTQLFSLQHCRQTRKGIDWLHEVLLTRVSVSRLRSTLSVVGILLLEVLRHVHLASVLGFAASSDLHDVTVSLSNLELAGAFVWLASLNGTAALAELERVGVASPASETSWCWVRRVVVVIIVAATGSIGGKVSDSSSYLVGD